MDDGPVRHLYIHVPFCRERCDYCEFYSLAVGEQPDGTLLDHFVAALLAEWQCEAACLAVRRLETVYLGGGSPSLLGQERLERLLATLEPLLTPHAELTVECNPEDVDAAFAAWAAARRVRVSLGVQSFHPTQRAVLGRRAAADPAAALSRLRAVGVANLSIDLIFGIPGQTAADVDADLTWIAQLRPDHVSWYELGVAPGTPLARRLAANLGPDAGGEPPRSAAGAANDDDHEAALYRQVVRSLSRLGYRWYEVSNFALPGRRARHNLAYWRGEPYLGLGPSAVSTVGDDRWRNRADTRLYVAALTDGRVPLREHERLDVVTQARERLMLAARTGARLTLDELEPCLERAALAPLAACGYISLHGGTLTITRKGRYVANEVCVRLFRDTCLQGAF